jgi:hypothetical protein
MKRVFLIMCGVCVASWLAAEPVGFSGRLSEADFNAAGMGKLTAEERVRLDALVAAETRRAEGGSTKREETVRGAKPEILHGKIAGALAGWEKGTVLLFEDGQRWQIVSEGRYRAAPVRKSPTVELFPLANGDYVMTVNSVPRRAEVRRVTD